MKIFKFILLLFFISQSNILSQNQDMISVSLSYFNVLKQKQNALEGRIEYKSKLNLWELKPFAGIMATTVGSFYFMAGFYIDLPITEHLIITPSFAPGYYHKGDGKDLAYKLEFRSQIELSYLFEEQTRIGISFNHISNANLGESNPGVESFAIHYSIPLSGAESN